MKRLRKLDLQNSHGTATIDEIPAVVRISTKDDLGRMREKCIKCFTQTSLVEIAERCIKNDRSKITPILEIFKELRQ